jgi:UDP-N-acetylmuramoyl-tripeptide--D-alanyl-D-alanine ligase
MKEIFKKAVIYFLTAESKAILRKYQPKIIAITGTVGKTSTRDTVYTALSEFEYARRSPKSFNTDIGIPLTIIGAKNPANVMDVLAWLKIIVEGLAVIFLPNHYPRWLVLEVGTDRPGDIKEITEWLRPDIVIVTKLSKIPVHVEAFGTPERLFEEKGNLVRALKPGGTLILNASDKQVMEYRNLTTENVITFGGGENYEIVYENALPVGVKFNVEGQNIFISGTIGEQHMEHIAAAMAVVKLLGENLAIAAKSLSRAAQVPGRSRLIEGINGSTIIDDTYNSSPVAVEEALKTLKETKVPRGGRRIAILGDMLELGRYTIEAHKAIGEKAAKVAKILVTVGIRSRATFGSAIEADLSEENAYHFENSIEAGRFMKNKIGKGDLILIKGSQGMRMEKVVEALMAHPEDKKKLLVRQDAEWRNR